MHARTGAFQLDPGKLDEAVNAFESNDLPQRRAWQRRPQSHPGDRRRPGAIDREDWEVVIDETA